MTVGFQIGDATVVFDWSSVAEKVQQQQQQNQAIFNATDLDAFHLDEKIFDQPTPLDEESGEVVFPVYFLPNPLHSDDNSRVVQAFSKDELEFNVTVDAVKEVDLDNYNYDLASLVFGEDMHGAQVRGEAIFKEVSGRVENNVIFSGLAVDLVHFNTTVSLLFVLDNDEATTTPNSSRLLRDVDVGVDVGFDIFGGWKVELQGLQDIPCANEALSAGITNLVSGTACPAESSRKIDSECVADAASAYGAAVLVATRIGGRWQRVSSRVIVCTRNSKQGTGFGNMVLSYRHVLSWE